MKSNKFMAIIVGMLVVAVGFGCVPTAKNPEDQASIKVTVLFFNDIHGHLMPFTVKTDHGKSEVGGIARLATLIKQIRFENEKKGGKTFLFVAGDILQGTPMSTVFHGEPDIKSMNAMKVDVMTVGNHEFDFGLQNFYRLKKLASFPFISANIVKRDSGERLCDSSVSFRLSEKIHLTVIGITTKQLLWTTRPENVSGLDVLEPADMVKKTYRNIQGSGPVILLSHSKHKTDREIALALPNLTAIIAGHDQILFEPVRKVGDVQIFQAFEKGKYLGRFDLEIDPVSGKTRWVSQSYIPITSDIETDKEIDGIVRGYYNRLGKKFKAVVGYTNVLLDGERERIRYEETNLGNFVTDIMREYTGADIALLNSGSLRASIDAGPIMLEDIFKVMPFANEIVLIDITGSELLQALNRSVIGNREDEDGGFLHVSGIRFVIKGHAAEDVKIGRDSMSLDPDKIYRVAITDFLTSGGDGYSIFVGKPSQYTGSPLRELIVDTVRNRGNVTAKIDGRIKRIGE
jgi:2',3'-cyclic-nucleotide 2'-phosphodiesterase (5'-nucleotidase family)